MMHIDRTFKYLTSEDVMTLHLHAGPIPYSIKDGLILSTLGRICSEFSQASGNEHINKILPLLGAFAALDQLGKCYRNTVLDEYPHDNASGIKKCLYYFGGFPANDENTKALYALRNSLVHDASLADPTPIKGTPQCFNYAETGNIVSFPIEPWDGVMANISPDRMTTVNPSKIIYLANECVRKACNLLDSGDLKVTLKEGSMMIKFKYLLFKPMQH